MNQTKIEAEIVRHSLSPQGDELISVLVTMPRIILSEMNTHRMLSKNTSSSRAIPFKKMVEAIENDPFIPIAWQKHHSGMQGNEYWDVTIKGEIGELDHTNIPAKWLRARDTAVTMAEVLHDGPQGVTKQLANRLLEPFMWTTMLITGSREGWNNFFNLRCPSYVTESTGEKTFYKSKKDAIRDYPNAELNTELHWFKANTGQAEIHMMALAECIWDAVNESTPKQLQAGEWHIPFEDKINIDGVQGIQFTLKDNSTKYVEAKWITEYKVKVSVGMAANTSYTVIGDGSIINLEKATIIHDKCKELNHSSVFEHCARAMDNKEYSSFIKGNLDAEIDTDGYIDISTHINNHNSFGWCNNLKGFIPYRYLVDNKIDI